MLATNIKKARKSLNITQRELAKRIGVSQQAVGSWETGRTSPDNEMLVKLAQIFDTTIDYLLGNSDDPMPPISGAAGMPAARRDVPLSERARRHAIQYDALSDDHKDDIDSQTNHFLKKEQAESEVSGSAS